jgi:transcriptional regulator with XRE-family HTH domain
MKLTNSRRALRSLSGVLGESLRRHRESKGLRQDDVAAVARSWGFDWTQATVAAYEIGRRDFSVEELQVLGYIAAHLTPATAAREDARPVELADLLPSAGEAVQLNRRVVIDASSLKPIWRGEARRFTLPLTTAPATGLRGDFDALTYKENVAVLDCLWPGARGKDRGEGGPIRDLLVAAHLDKLGDAEQKAARRLRTFSLAVATTARKRWERSFTEERDRRVTEQAPADATPATLQALRGHVTRALLEELRQEGIEGLKPERGSKTRQKAIGADWQRAIRRVQEGPTRKKGGSR